MRNSRLNVGKIFLSVAWFILSLVVFTGCIPNNFTREEERAFLQEAEKVALDYLGEAYGGAAIKEIESETTVEDNGYVLTEFASGQFVWQKQVYDFVVNTKTGEVYTSVCFSEIEERLREELCRELDIVNFEAAVVSCDIRYLKGCENPRIWVDIRSAFHNVFPEGETADELFRKILEDTEEYLFSMSVQYKGEDIPQEIMEENAPFPTLYYVNIYHIAEEHGFYGGEYNNLTLPSLSEEILWRNYSKDASGYTRNQVMERDGFQVVYNAYERTREQDTVEVAVIDAEDILFTITEDYINLDCTKENYTMYLSTTDKKMAKKYLYAFDYIFSEEKLQTGMWYPYEDRYVYADDTYTKVPHEFCNRHRETNTIYTNKVQYEHSDS